MGLLDSIAGQVLGAALGGNNANAPSSGMVDAIGGLLNNTGGLSGLIQIFQQQGMGNVVSSWVGTGQNLPISAEQLQSVLGNQTIQAIAQQLGFSPQDVAQQLSQFLPQIVDKLTPTGQVPENNGLGGLGGLLGNVLKGLGN